MLFKVIYSSLFTLLYVDPAKRLFGSGLFDSGLRSSYLSCLNLTAQKWNRALGFAVASSAVRLSYWSGRCAW